jgi:hypothetical protein
MQFYLIICRTDGTQSLNVDTQSLNVDTNNINVDVFSVKMSVFRVGIKGNSEIETVTFDFGVLHFRFVGVATADAGLFFGIVSGTSFFDKSLFQFVINRFCTGNILCGGDFCRIVEYERRIEGFVTDSHGSQWNLKKGANRIKVRPLLFIKILSM